MQNVAPEVIEVEQRAKGAGLTMASILAEVGVAQSTWWRWRKGGVEPRLSTLREVAHALDRRIAAPETVVARRAANTAPQGEAA
jgi:transcriptional regulator with XRE-family HTH domain